MDVFGEKVVNAMFPVKAVASVIQPKESVTPLKDIMDTLTGEVIVTGIKGDTVIDIQHPHHIHDVTILVIHQVNQMKMRMKLKGRKNLMKWRVKQAAVHLQLHLHLHHPVLPVIHLQVTILTLNMILTNGFIHL